MTPEQLLKLPPTRALIHKWNEGVAVHGSVDFKGNPRAELYCELLDAICYCDQIQVQNDPLEHAAQNMRRDLMRMAEDWYEYTNPPEIWAAATRRVNLGMTAEDGEK